MFETASQRLARRLSGAGARIVILIGTTVLLAWGLDLAGWINVVPRFVSMNPITAVLLALGGGGLLAQLPLYPETSSKLRRRVASACAWILIAVGALKLIVYAFPGSLDFGSLMVRDRFGAHPLFARNELAPNAALNFLMIGAGLLLLDKETTHGFRPAQPLFLGSALVAVFALFGYVYDVVAFYSVGEAIPMALNTAVAFGILSLAGLGARPDRGIMAVVTSNSIAGAMARRLLPAAVLMPLVLGMFQFMDNSDLGLSAFAIMNVILFTLLIWWNARLLFGVERERAQAERRLALQYSATRVLAEAPNAEQATYRLLKSICSMLNWPAAAFWRVNDDAQVLHCAQTHSESAALESLMARLCKESFPRGVGLPGNIWKNEAPQWIPEISACPPLHGTVSPVAAGLRSAIGFPIRFNGQVCGVMEFFKEVREDVDDRFLEMLDGLGSQIGQFLERKQAEEQFRKASADLERSNTELQQFAYVASHDLTEPLRMVVSYLQLLQSSSRGKLDAESQQFVAYAVDGARRLQVLIADLLSYARVNSGRPFEPVDCEAVIERARDNLGLRIQETGAVIEHTPLPTVTGDASQLTQVFQNLLSNAIKFRGPAPLRIRVSAKPANGEWLFSIQDNGIGLDPKHAERIFVLFQRLHTRQEYSGTGIGLAICKKVIERHGGRIWVESNPGDGATFFFTLPTAR